MMDFDASVKVLVRRLRKVVGLAAIAQAQGEASRHFHEEIGATRCALHWMGVDISQVPGDHEAVQKIVVDELSAGVASLARIRRIELRAGRMGNVEALDACIKAFMENMAKGAA